MSFAGTLLLTGAGGLLSKYGYGQRFEVDPATQIPLGEYPDKVYMAKWRQILVRSRSVFHNFINDILSDGAGSYLYPFRSYKMFMAHATKYSLPVLTNLTVYLGLFSLITIVYWATITPMYTALFIFLGPVGIALAIVHSVLQTNVFAMMILRTSHLNSILVTDTIKLRTDETLISQEKPVRYYVPLLSTYFWLYQLPIKSAKYISGLLVLTGLLGVSFIPILGPILFHTLISPFITALYLDKYYRLRGVDNLQRKEEIYKHPGAFTMFGLMAGFLESIPIVAGFTFSTNTIAAALWGIDKRAVPAE